MTKTKRNTLIILAAVLLLILAFVIGRSIALHSANNLIILMYHDVQDNADGSNSAVVSTDKIDADFDWIVKNGYTSVLPKDLINPDFKIPKKAVLISFDDGYKSNYEKVYPLLAKYNLKAEINVLTSIVDDEAHINICRWHQLKEMSDSGLVEIGSHTDNLHNPESNGILNENSTVGVLRLKGESDADYEERVTKDILLSKEKIEKKLGKEVVCFAYPYGALDKDAKKTVESNFKISFGVQPGINYVNGKKFNLHRYQVTNTTDISDILIK